MAIPRMSGVSRRFGRLVALTLGLATAFSLAGIVAGPALASTPACTASQLSARILDWQGAAGSRIADVRLYNTSFTSCYVRNFPQVRLVSRTGHALITGHTASTTGAAHAISALHYLVTEVQTTNYCGPAFSVPATLTFTLTGTLGRVVAIPLTTTDTSGVPPCNGAPGSAGSISMHAWS
jgi:hypothetical protein